MFVSYCVCDKNETEYFHEKVRNPTMFLNVVFVRQHVNEILYLLKISECSRDYVDSTSPVFLSYTLETYALGKIHRQ